MSGIRGKIHNDQDGDAYSRLGRSRHDARAYCDSVGVRKYSMLVVRAIPVSFVNTVLAINGTP